MVLTSNEKLNQIQSSYENTVYRNGDSLLINGECLQVMSRLPSASMDCIITDLPYGITQNKWDSVIPLDLMWKQFNRVCKEDGMIVLTATQPFTSLLVASNIRDFKYEIIWEKTISSGQLNVKHQPLRSHESILIFYRKKGTYNEQKTEGEPYSINRKVTYEGEGYGKQKNSSKQNDGYRHAKSVIKIPNPRVKGGHPTQKPLALMDHLVRAYSNPGDVILDCCMGSGTTGVSAQDRGRGFVGIELDPKYFEMAKRRFL